MARGRLLPLMLACLAIGQGLRANGAPAAAPHETVGGGTVYSPAVGPPPSFGIGGPGMVLVKNWHFGTDGTIKNYADLSEHFFYHDQFKTFNNGGNYGSNTASPDFADSIGGQPIEGVDCPPVRKFTADSLVTTLAPIHDAKTLSPPEHNTANGSFMAKWRLPHGGSLLGRDIVWETRVRYVTPPYFWFALWTAGNKWKWDGHAQGAEQDLVESFGYDNGGGNTNFDGRFWHSDSVAWPAKDTVDYGNWGAAMAKQGIPTYDASRYHVWTWLYRKDNSYAMYVDGKLVQQGSNYYWTFGNGAKDEPIDLVFLFDGGWGHNQVGSVNKPLPASALDGKYYEWNYSRVYLGGDPPAPARQTRTGLTLDTGGTYQIRARVSSAAGGRFHLEDETGRNLTGTLVAPRTGKGAVEVAAVQTPMLAAGGHVLTCVPESGAVRLERVTASLAATGAAAKYLRTDRATGGNWQGVYGSDGYVLANGGAPKLPPYASVNVATWSYTWDNSTSEARALQMPGSTARVAAQWGSNDPSFDIDCSLADGKTHQVALYGLDWDRGARNEDIQVLDGRTHAVLDELNFNTFVNGAYAVWNIRGRVIFHVVNRGGSNLALSGIFFDPAGGGKDEKPGDSSRKKAAG